MHLCAKETKHRRNEPAIERDAQGYPRTARRRLKKNRDDAGTVTDIDTGQRFKVRKTREGDRIVPLFDKQVQWKSASGHDALRLCLSCLGAPGEYVLWDEATGAEMTRDEWGKRKFVNTSKPAIKHSCGQVVTTTAIASIGGGQSVGCPKCVSQLRVWSERFTEFTAMLPEGYTLELNKDEWQAQCMGGQWCPPIRCTKHRLTIRTTSIANLTRRQGVGCPGCVSQMNPWSDRYAEFKALLPDGYTLQLTEDEWKQQCTGASFCPPIRCERHELTTNTTCIHSLDQTQCIGCPECHSDMLPWSGRFGEFLELIPSGYTLQLTEDEWKEQCTSCYWCPPLRCTTHGSIATTTSITSMQQGHGVGCVQCFPLLARKTEATVLEWLESAFPAATIAREVRGPGRTRFDFVLTFGDNHVVLEVDGPQHFWKDYFMYTERIPERDAEKARWALARGQWVVRVLANDVFWDRNGWRAWLRRAIDEARAGAATTGAAPRVLTPDAPEYRSPESAYIGAFGAPVTLRTDTQTHTHTHTHPRRATPPPTACGPAGRRRAQWCPRAGDAGSRP